MSHVITLIPGDGIGPEVTESVIRIFKAAGLDIEWERHDAGITAFKRVNQSLPVDLLESIRRNKVALKGPVTTPIAEGFTSVNVGLRKALNLFANLRPVRNLPGVASRFPGVDLVIVRENTEDLYAGLEHEVIPGVVESLKIITEKASTRIADFAFEHARQNGRKKVTAIHKANIMKLGDGLFLESAVRCRRAPRHRLRRADRRRGLHAAGDAARKVRRPRCCPTCTATSCRTCAPVWSAASGSCPGPTSGTEAAVFEAVHGSAPDIADKNLANPTALLLSGADDARPHRRAAAAERIRAALVRVLVDGASGPGIWAAPPPRPISPTRSAARSRERRSGRCRNSDIVGG